MESKLTQQGLAHRIDGPVVVGFPVIVSLFIFAAALGFGVAPSAALLLGILTGLATWTNTRLMAGSGHLGAYSALLTLKLALLVYQIQFRNLPLSGSDWSTYHRGATMLMNDAGGALLQMALSPDWDLFTRITSILYTLFGATPEQMYFWVFLTSLVTFTYIYKSAHILLDSPVAAPRVALFFMIWPNEIVLSVTFLREMPIQMLVAASLYHFLTFWRDRNMFGVLLSITLSLAATLMHSGMIVLPIAYAYLVVRSPNRPGLQVVRTAVFAAATFLVLRSSVAAPLLMKFGDLDSIGDVVDLGANSYAQGASTYYLNPGLGDTPLIQLPYRFLVFAFSPLPWQATSAGTAAAVLVDGIPQLFVVILLMACLVKCRSFHPQRATLIVGLVVAVLVAYFIFSLGVSTYGTAMRHRAKLFPVSIILAYLAASTMRWDAVHRRQVSLLGKPNVRWYTREDRTHPLLREREFKL